MRVLWVTYDIPFPLNSGGKLRAYSLMKSLSEKFEISLFSFYRNKEQLRFLPELKKFLKRVDAFFRPPVWNTKNLIKASLSLNPLLLVSYESKDLAVRLRESLKKDDFDLVQLEFLGVAGVLPMIKECGIPVVLGNENIEYHIYKKYSQGVKNPLLRFFMGYDVWKMRRKEERYWKIADINLAVSPEDLAVMENSGVRNAYLVPNGVDVSFYQNYRKEISSSKVLNKALFTGDLQYSQNGEAIRWFAERVLPLIKKEIPDFKLVIVSAHRPEWLSKFDSLELIADSSSEFIEFADKADIFVLPVWVKSGTNIKLLQAAAVGFPIVSTTAGLSGYDFLSDEVSCANTPLEFSSAVVKLLRQEELRRKLSDNVLKSVKKYDWKNSANILARLYEGFKSS